MLISLRPKIWDRLANVLPAHRRPRLFGDKLHKLAEVVALDRFDEVYPRLVAHWPLDAELVPGEGHGRGSAGAGRARWRARRRVGANAASGSAHLLAGRYSDQGGPGQHGILARSAGAAARPPGGRARVAPAGGSQNPRWRGQVDLAPRAGALRAAGPVPAAEDGVRGAHRPLAARAATRLGGGPAPPARARRGRAVQRRPGAPAVGGAPGGDAQLAVLAVDRADGAGVAPAVAGRVSGGAVR